MSAYLVESTHLSAILTWAIENQVIQADRAQDCFEQMYLENVKSLKYRYEDCEDMIYWDLTTDRFKLVYDLVPKHAVREQVAIAIGKLINCWDYQSCEHPEYKREPLAWEIAKKIKRKAHTVSCFVSQNPLYEEIYELAPWDYNSEVWQRFISSLPKKTPSLEQKTRLSIKIEVIAGDLSYCLFESPAKQVYAVAYYDHQHGCFKDIFHYRSLDESLEHFAQAIS